MKIKSLLALFFLITGLANADLVPGLTIESATVGLNPEMGPEKAINGFGLEGDVPSLTASHREQFSSNWWSGWSGEVTEWQITVDLEENYKLDAIHIWNYREGCCGGRGLSEVEIYVSPDENEDNLVKLITNGTGDQDGEDGGFFLPRGPTGGDYLGFDLDVSGVANSELLNNVRLFRIDGGSALHGDGQVHGGLAEIQFDGSPPVDSASPFQLLATTGTSGVNFSWQSSEGKLYDLVSAPDLSTPVEEWLVFEDYENIEATAPLNVLENVVLSGSRRFFALVEKSGD
jgi:hypothetical protein